ncbi:pyruvate,orthophosphate dikinase [Litoreibacter ponti]|uniref:Pyruvate, phosphate dikinase n=1 Tax=Litoreibacter ponti TaxID=1510457 RepID=A0A2T6BJY6_9RHOB|nr:putative PEP-binding protein [Litoreibacter ponti]PTX56374.1 pyruvate,orthophosphate dikinase [Litoreibacter ponti]
MLDRLNFERITPTAAIQRRLHGTRAKCLQRLIRLGMPVPDTVALSIPLVRSIAAGQQPDMKALLEHFGSWPVLSVRASTVEQDWGGPSTVLNIGMNRTNEAFFASRLGADAAKALHLKFIKSYAVDVARLDDEIFDIEDLTVAKALDAYEMETDEAFPEDIEIQLAQVLKSMARAWEGTSARLLRMSKGAPEDAGLGLVVQRMAFGMGKGESGAGVIQFVNSDTGKPQEVGRYKRQSQGRDALSSGEGDALYLTRDKRGPSLQDSQPEVFDALCELGAVARKGLREEMQIEFTVEGGTLHILDAVAAPRSARAEVRIATDLAKDGVISREDAVMRIEPRAIGELLHPQVAGSAKRDVFARGIAASPGAATGKLVFDAMAAQTSASQGEACILVRRETSPEDVRGMHAAKAILTERGGANGHAAVIARGLGLPCVTGATSIDVDTKKRTVTSEDGRVLSEGDVVTLDGSSGQVLAGSVPLVEAGIGGAFRELLGWADAVRDIGVRANADTPEDANVAEMFNAEGIGLCRTEHMFFGEDRLTVLREAVFAEDDTDRAAALSRLLPMQRADFLAMFLIMAPRPVCLRLFDPPLHEFLPSTREGILQLADALDMSAREVQARIEDLSEQNPMLGLRGVRLGITMPEIYEMQARAIFEAAIEASVGGVAVVPEIMIPLVSAKREVELVKSRIDAVAADVMSETGKTVEFRLGVMVETPRAALRAGDIATHASFLSFGTNDMTQMTYGLSRDDAGRFMSDYVNQGVFPEDPFLALDQDGVGELLALASERGRIVREKLTLSVCGEHGGDPESIAFCRSLGMDYVSCSPYRVPIARLAAAQLAIREPGGDDDRFEFPED